MPWQTPSIDTVRSNNRDYITAKLKKPLIPNDYPRVLADANAGNAHLNLQYLDWQADQYLPDTAEKQFLDRHGNIWLVNSDGSRGRKSATYASGSATATGLVAGAVVPQFAQLTATVGSATLTFEVTTACTVGVGANPVTIRALDPGASGNLPAGTSLSLTVAVPGLDASSFQVVSLSGGADEENDDDLRARVLDRIQKPPMGGCADDYVKWALAVPGVTRAWCSPTEQGIGTVTLRFMCDDLRATSDPTTNGFPLPADIAAVQSYVDMVRPVTVKDFYVAAPVPQPAPFALTNMLGDSVSLRAAIAASIDAMLLKRAKPAYAANGVPQPAQTIYAAWISEAVSATAGVTVFDLVAADAVMPSPGCLAVRGAIS